ncbi:MAG: nucleoside triphosphate pyrophosphohydrolase [Pseudomonadota bacterium]
MKTPPTSRRSIDALLAIMADLRDRDGGCPWDLQQTFQTIAPYTIEEAYEVADAIAREDTDDLRDELGDLLLQVVYHAQIATEARHFSFADVVEAVVEKMIRRHPHVYGSETRDAAGQTLAWEAQKEAERAAKAGDAPVSVLDGIAPALPALTRALKLQKRAARVGFDWDRPEPILGKLTEELDELAEALDATTSDGKAREAALDELGDVLFVLVNFARHHGLDPEEALRRTNRKFDRRFRFIEAALTARGDTLEAASLEEMEALWQQAKSTEPKP